MDKSTEPTVIHVSVGSAANSTHLSTDVALDDEKLTEKIDKFFDLWEKTRIVRERLDMRRK